MFQTVHYSFQIRFIYVSNAFFPLVKAFFKVTEAIVTSHRKHYLD